uniref:(northern house mosquito) hypothetical protein n=1 Tax=Culex pipiens TaxID=7175 RepID=A0A8D8IHA1_CULPI
MHEVKQKSFRYTLQHFPSFLSFSFCVFWFISAFAYLFVSVILFLFVFFCLVVKFDVCSKDECRFSFALFSALALAVASGSLSRVVTCMCVCEQPNELKKTHF